MTSESTTLRHCIVIVKRRLKRLGRRAVAAARRPKEGKALVVVAVSGSLKRAQGRLVCVGATVRLEQLLSLSWNHGAALRHHSALKHR